MKRNYGRKGSLGYVTLVTALSTAGLWGCDKPVVCGPGTVLTANGQCEGVVPVPCAPGERQNATTMACERIDPCAGVNCGDVQLPTGVARLDASPQGTA